MLVYGKNTGLVTANREWTLNSAKNLYYHFENRNITNQKIESKLPGNMIEIKELDLVVVDDTILAQQAKGLPDKLTDISIAHVLKHYQKSSEDFMQFFNELLPDWYLRINYRGGKNRLVSKKITNKMFELIDKNWKKNNAE